MSDKEIRIECEGAAKLELDKIEPFQGELKSLTAENYERLKKSILELGFSFPLQVWRSKGKYYCVDGHQRDRVLTKMKEEGYIIPLIPVVWVEAKNSKEAKLKILAATSSYGQMESQGLYEFMSEANITFPDIESSFSFPEIDFKQFNDEFFTDPPIGEAIKTELRTIAMKHILISIPIDKCIDAVVFLNEIRKIDGIEYEETQN